MNRKDEIISELRQLEIEYKNKVKPLQDELQGLLRADAQAAAPDIIHGDKYRITEDASAVGCGQIGEIITIEYPTYAENRAGKSYLAVVVKRDDGSYLTFPIKTVRSMDKL